MFSLVFLFSLFFQDNPDLDQMSLTPHFTLSGLAAIDKFGEIVETVGDVDDDGYMDLAVSAHCISGDAGPMSGVVQIFSGFDGRKIYEFNGSGPFDRFGLAIASAELTDDNRIDIIIGAPYADKNSIQSCGYVTIYSGADGKPVKVLHGANKSARFGSSICCMDIDADGVDDILIGAPGEDGETGAVYLYSGFDFSLLSVFKGENSADWFGSSICCIDLDGNGFADPIIAAPGFDSKHGKDAGIIYSFSGADGRIIYKSVSDDDSSFFGSSVSATSDISGDGIQDLIALNRGKPNNTYILNGATGKIIFTLESNIWSGYFPSPTVAVDDMDMDELPDIARCESIGSGNFISVHSGVNGALIKRFRCSAPINGFGYTLCGPLGSKLTGYPRLAVASNPYINQGDDQVGVVNIFNLAPPEIRCRILGDFEKDRFGFSVDIINDINGDKFHDLLVGIPGEDGEAGIDCGAIAVFPDFGGDCSLYIEGQAPGSLFGSAITILSDTNSDGKNEIIIGAPGTKVGDFKNAGAVYFYSSASGALRDTVIKGGRADEKLGEALAIAGDVNGDMRSEFIVGVPGYCEADRIETGKIIIFDGKNLDTVMEFTGDVHRGRLGHVLGIAGDLNDDGILDFLSTSLRSLKASDDPEAELPVIERVFVFSPKQKEPLLVIPAPKKDEDFGEVVTGVTDINGDEIPELIIAAPSFKGCLGGCRGTVYFYSGKDGQLMGSISGEKPGDHFGKTITLIPDINGDDKNEIVICTGGVKRSIVYIFSSKDLSLLHSIDLGVGKDNVLTSASGAIFFRNVDNRVSFVGGAGNFTSKGRKNRGAAIGFSYKFPPLKPIDGVENPKFQKFTKKQ